jgi:hypothetical protein
MLRHELLPDHGVLVVEPVGPLQSADFEALAKIVDPYIEQHGGLKGLMIVASGFPGWASFGALVNHVRFVKDHHRKIARIAAVTDSDFLAILPKVANHFVAAEVRHFASGDRSAALKWLTGG